MHVAIALELANENWDLDNSVYMKTPLAIGTVMYISTATKESTVKY